MEYNKRRFQKANDKKVLHKVRKHWVVMSMALLMAIGGGAAVTHASANADTANNNSGNQNDGSTNTIKERLNQTLVQGQKQAQSNNNQSAQQANRAQLNNQASAQANSHSISQQASALHQRILHNVAVNQAPSGQGRVANNNEHQELGASENQASNSNVNSNVTKPNNNVKSSIDPINTKNKVASDIKVTQFNIKNDVDNQKQVLKHNIGVSDDTTVPPFDYNHIVSQGNIPSMAGIKPSTAKWSLDNNGVFLIHDGDFRTNSLDIQLPSNIVQGIKYIEFHNVNLPGVWALDGLPNVRVIDMSGINPSSPFPEDGNPHSHGKYWTGFWEDPKLVTVNFGHNLDASHMTGDMGSFFTSDKDLKNLIGFSDLNLSSVIDVNDWFLNDTSLTNLDISNFNTAAARANNHSGGDDNGLSNFVSGCNNLRTIKLGPTSILTSKAINGNSDGSFSFDPKTGQLINVADGQPHPGKWVLLQGAQRGTWGTAHWILDQNGDLVVYNGTLSFNDWVGFNHNAVKHVYTYNVKANPTSHYNSGSYFDGAYNEFANLPNVESIDLSGVDFSNTSTFTDMLWNEPKLKYLNLGNLNTRSALSNNVGLNRNGLSGMLYSTHLDNIVLGPNTILDQEIYTNGTGQGHPTTIFSYNSGNRANITKLTDKQPHPGTWNVMYGNVGNWGTATWALDNTNNTLYIANGSMITDDQGNHGIPWNNVKHIDTYNVTAPNYMGWLFSGHKGLQSVDLSGMNTHGVFDMSGVLDDDSDLQNVKFGPNFDTSNVDDFNYMFISDTNIKTLDLSNFDTRKALNNVSSGLNSGSGLGSMLSNSDSGPKSYKNPVPQQTLILGPNTILSGTSNLPSGDGLVNIENDQELTNSDTRFQHLNDNQPHPGIWTRNAEILDYMNGNTKVGSQVVGGKLGSTVTVGDKPLNLPDQYQVTSPNQTVTINGGVTPIPVEDDSNKTVGTNINVVYETSNDQKLASDNVPITLEGSDNTDVDFYPANLVTPQGYQLDFGNNRTKSSYQAKINGNTVNWTNGQPTIYFKGVGANQSVTINNVIESPAGHIMDVKQSSQNINSNVGDSYTVTPAQSFDGDSLASGNQQNANHNGAVTGQIAQDGSNVYLSKPVATFFYVSPDTSNITVHYIDQVNNNEVGSHTFNGALDSTLNNDSINNSKPSGYTLSGNNSFTYGQNAQDVNVNVMGDSRTVTVNYKYNNHTVGTKNYSKPVGSQMSLTSDNYMPAGYKLVPNQNTEYTVKDNNAAQTVQIVPTEKTVPVQFMFKNNKFGDGKLVYCSDKGTIGSSITLPNAPQGYSYADPSQRNYKLDLGNVSASNPDQMNPVTVNLKGNPEALTVKYLDQDGDQVNPTNQDTITGHSVGDQINPSSLVPLNNSAYTMDSDQPDATSYTLKPNDNPLVIHVHTVKQRHLLLIEENEWTNHKPGKDGKSRSNSISNVITIPHMITGAVGQTFNYYPSKYNITDYAQGHDKEVNEPMTVKITDQGLAVKPTNASDSAYQQQSDISWNYTAQKVNDAFNVTYYDATTKKQVSNTNTVTVSGMIDSHNTITNHATVPSGYVLDPNDKTEYVVTPKTQNITLKVYPEKSAPHYYNLKIVTMDPTDKTQLSSTTVPVQMTVNANQQQTINASDYYPNGDKNSYKLDTSNGRPSSVKVTNNDKGLESGTTFYYVATTKQNGSKVQPISIHYINQDGDPIYTSYQPSSDSYVGQKISDVTNGTLPAGYTVYQGQQVSGTLSNVSSSITVYIQGEDVKALAPIKLMHTSSYYPDQNDPNRDPSNPQDPMRLKIPEFIYLPISGRVGDRIQINDNVFAGYIPQGYQFADKTNAYDPETDFTNYIYNGQLTPEDAQATSKAAENNSIAYLNSNTWKSSSNDKHWWTVESNDNPNVSKNEVIPLVLLQAKPNRTIYFNFFNQNNKLLSFPRNGKLVNSLKISADPSDQLPGKKPFNPSYNDPIDISSKSPYLRLLPSGYYYDSNRNTQPIVRFGLDTKTVSIYLQGKKETVNVQYMNGDSRIGSDKSIPTQVGEQLTIPTDNFPQGYHLTNPRELKYTVNYADDPENPSHSNKADSLQNNTGTITYDVDVAPDSETLPIKFVNQSDQQVGGIDYSTKGKIDQTVNLPSAPQGYQLNSSDAKAYKFKASDMDSNNYGFLNQITMKVTGDKPNVTIHYVDANGTQIGSDVITGQVGSNITLPTTTKEANQTYKLSPNYTLSPHGSVMIKPSDDNGRTVIPLTVVGRKHDVSMNIHVVYENGQGQTTASDNVPIKVTGQYDTTTHFNPANLAQPAGYQLDSSKDASNYAVKLDANQPSGEWLDENGQPAQTDPTIYLKSGSANKDLNVNRVVESPAGMIMSIDHVTYPISEDVGDDYSVDPSQIKLPNASDYLAIADDDNLSGQNDPNYSDNKTMTGKVLESGSQPYLSQPDDTVYFVDPDAKSNVTVHYIDQAHNDVGTYSFNQFAGSTLKASDVSNNVPQGYTYGSNNLNNVSFGKNDKDIDVNVNGQPASVGTEYYDGATDLNKSAGFDNGKVGDSFTLPTNNVPQGYHLAGNAPVYTLQPSDASTKTVEPIQVVPNEMTLPINFVEGANHVVGTTMIQGGRDDTSDAIPKDQLPVGYQLNNQNSDIYNFKANSIQNDNLMSTDTVHVTAYQGQPITLQFKFKNANYDVEDDTVHGDYGKALNAMDYLPEGYHLDTQQNAVSQLHYSFGNAKRSKTIYVQPDQGTGPNLSVHLKFVTPSGQQMSGYDTDAEVPLNANADGYFDIKPGDTRLASYISGFKPVANQQDITGANGNGLTISSNPDQTFTYQALPKTMNVQFVDQSGQAVKTAQVNGYYGKSVDVTSELPTNYQYVSGQKQYTLANNNPQATVLVKGNLTSNQVAVNLVREDPNGKNPKTVTITKSLSGLVGDKQTISASDFQSYDKAYELDPDKPNQAVTETLEPGNGSKASQPTVTFYYRSTATTDTNNLKPIQIVYIAGGEEIGKTSIAPKQGDYAGEVFNSTTRAGDLPAGYQFVNGENVPVAFSTSSQPANVLKLVRKPGSPLTFDAEVIQKFYDPSGKQLLSTNVARIPESGNVGSDITIDPQSYTVPGYQFQPNNDVKHTVTITPHSLKNGVVTYSYDAEKTSDPNSSAQPIYVTYKDGDNTIGTADQRIDGYTGETIDVLNKVQPTDASDTYHMTPGQDPLASFSTQPQHIILNVLPDAQDHFGTINISYVDPDAVRENNKAAEQISAARSGINDLTTNDPTIKQAASISHVKTLMPMVLNRIAQNGFDGQSFNDALDTLAQNVPNSKNLSDLWNNVKDTPEVRNFTDKTPMGHLASEVISDILKPTNSQYAQLNQAYQAVKNDSNWCQLVKDMKTLAVTRTSTDDQGGASNPSGTGSRNLTASPVATAPVLNRISVYDYAGKSFELSPYETSVPQGYQFKDVENNGDSIDQFTGGTQNITIDVDKVVSDQIVYKDVSDADEPNQTFNAPANNLVGMQTDRDVQGTPINYAKYATYVPNGYKFDHLDANVENNLTGGKTNVIWVKHNRTHIFSTIHVNYVEYDDKGNKIGTVSQDIHGRSGDRFDLASYEDQIPEGYEFQGADNKTPMDNFTDHDQTVNISVKQPVKVPQYGVIRVHFLKSDNSAKGYHPVGAIVTVTGHNNTVFDASPFEHSAPEGYNYAGLINDRTHSVPQMFNGAKPQDLYIRVE